MRDKLRKILRPLPQRSNRQGKHIDAVEQIAAKGILLDQFLEMAMRGHQHAHVDFDRFVAAHALNFACMARGMSPISSRKSVPASACSNLPRWREAAPVNEPFSWPKSSDSISSAGTAAQFRVMNGWARRGDFS